MLKMVRTDNYDLAAKVALRRYFLRRYHRATPPRVLDCCQGSGLIWGRLRREFRPSEYLGLDVKARRGRLKIDSTRFLSQPGWFHDVIDIDTYGSPWKLWAAMLPNVVRPVTVFLTIGFWRHQTVFGASVDDVSLKAMGCVFAQAKIPNTLRGSLQKIARQYCLAMAYKHDVQIIEAAEAISGGTAGYVGVRLEPARQSAGPRCKVRG